MRGRSQYTCQNRRAASPQSVSTEHAAECLSGFVGQELEVGKSSKRGVRIDGKYFGKHRLPHYSLSTGLVLTEDGIAAHTVFIKKRYFMPDRDGTILQALKKYALACNPDLSL